MGTGSTLVEIAWRPGRCAVLTEIESIPTDHAVGLRVSLAVGSFGPAGTTADEIDGLRPYIDHLIGRNRGSVVRGQPMDPSTILPSLSDDKARIAGWRSAVIRQRCITVRTGDESVEIPSRFNPTIEQWSGIAQRLVDLAEPVRVRATVLATELSALDRFELQAGVAQVQAMLNRADARDHPETAFHADRALATLLDLQASFTSPLLIAEIAVLSPRALPESFLRSIGACFTSELEVLRRHGQVVVAGQRLVLGGFELERDPVGLIAAQAVGLPLRGGTGSRELRDLVTLTESPIGWPVPLSGSIHSIAADCPRPRPVPTELLSDPHREATILGADHGGHTICLPVARRTLHTLVTGTWGSGKSTILTRTALDDLRHGRGFVFIDPHGTAADWLTAFADDLKINCVVLDADDPGTERMAPIGAMGAHDQRRPQIEQQIANLTNAVASSLPDPQWTGPRWQATMRSAFELVAVHNAELVDLVTWLNDPKELAERIGHRALSDLPRSTLANRCGRGDDAASVPGWASSKLHTIVSGPARKLLAKPGQGVDLAVAVRTNTLIVANLGALATSECQLIGHLVLGAVLEAAMNRPPPQRQLFTAYVDEIHRFPARGLTRILAEGRKFGTGLVGANQALSQLSGELADSALGSATAIAFRATPDTAAQMSANLDLSARELRSLPDLECIVSVAGGGSTRVCVPPYEPSPAMRTKGDTGNTPHIRLVPCRCSDGPRVDGRRRRPCFGAFGRVISS